MHKRILVFLLLGVMAGCSTTATLSGTMADMQGASIGNAFTAWGEPEATETMGEQTVFVWRDYAAGASVPIVICERMLAADDSGTVTGWRWRGDACESIDEATRANSALARAR